MGIAAFFRLCRQKENSATRLSTMCEVHGTLSLLQEEIEELVATDRWLGVMLEARQLSRHRQMEKHPLDMRREGESLLLAGSQWGYLVLLDEINGSVKFSVRGHRSAVNIIACNPKKNQVISASGGKLFGRPEGNTMHNIESK